MLRILTKKSPPAGTAADGPDPDAQGTNIALEIESATSADNPPPEPQPSVATPAARRLAALEVLAARLRGGRP